MGIERFPDAEGPDDGSGRRNDAGPGDGGPDARSAGSESGGPEARGAVSEGSRPRGDADLLLDHSPSRRAGGPDSPDGAQAAGEPARPPDDLPDVPDDPLSALDWEDIRDRVVRIIEVESGDPENSVNRVLETTLDDRSMVIYKPISGEAPGVRTSIPHGGAAHREVAASRLDTELGIGLVPPTRRCHGPEGPGSAQDFVVSMPEPRGIDVYDAGDQELMAVLDYVSGNTDRHQNNYRTAPDGRPVAIDNGYSFPESDADPIRSDFIAAYRGEPLSDELITRLRAVDAESLSTLLQQEGLSEPAARGARDRLREVQDQGAITFTAWPGVVINASRGLIKERD